MSLSKKLRFEVFKRDGFKCQYCGNTPPLVTLEVDHIVPVSKNGTDEIYNLITSCFDCNRGKSNIELSAIPKSTSQQTAELIEREEQYKAYRKIVLKIKKRQDSELEAIDDVYNSYFPSYRFNEGFKNGTIKPFIKQLGFDVVEQAMHMACGRIHDSGKAAKYFCGICWNKIKDKD